MLNIDSLTIERLRLCAEGEYPATLKYLRQLELFYAISHSLDELKEECIMEKFKIYRREMVERFLQSKVRNTLYKKNLDRDEQDAVDDLVHYGFVRVEDNGNTYILNDR